MADIDQIINQWKQKHGDVQGAPYAIDPTIKNASAAPGDPTDSPNPDPVYRYTFADGSFLEMNQGGQIKASSEKPPTAGNNGFTDIVAIKNANGTTTRYGKDPKDGQFKPLPGVPTEPSTTKPVSPITDYQPFKDDSGRVIAYVDPKDPSNRIPIPQGTEKPADGAVKDTFDAGSNRAVHWIAKSGEWTIKSIDAAPTDATKPKEGDTRPNVSGGYQVREVYRGGSWVTDPTFTAVPYSPDLANKPKEGDTRRNVQSGQAITEKFVGGQWVTDPSVPPVPFDAGKPKDGDVRPNTDPKGQAIQEIYRGGQWVTDTSVPPKPFGTQAPQVINAGTGPNIVRQDPTTGAVSTIPNPNTTDVAARTGQLQDQARAKQAELNKQIQSGVKTPEEAAADFDAWWATTVDPFAQQLTQQQKQVDYDAQTKQRDQARLEQETQRAAFTTAEAAGQDAVHNATNFGPGVEQVGPGYGAALSGIMGAFSSGKMPGAIDGNSLTWQAPDLNEIARQGTAAALAHISPTAASILGKPMPNIPQGFDVQGALNKSTYAPRGTTLVHPDGTVEVKPPDPPAYTPSYVPGGGRGSPGLDYGVGQPSY